MILCPVCEKYEFESDNDFDICEVCGWENDGVQLDDPNYWGGANDLSLNEARLEHKLLQNKITAQKTKSAYQTYRKICKQIYIKYESIDYRVDGDKICHDLKLEHDRYVSHLEKLSKTIVSNEKSTQLKSYKARRIVIGSGFISAIIMALFFAVFANHFSDLGDRITGRDTQGLIPIGELLEMLNEHPYSSNDEEGNNNRIGSPIPIYFDILDESTHAFSTLARVEGHNISLLGGVGDRGIVLYYNGQHDYFDWRWLNPRINNPIMIYRDFTGNGKNDLAVILHRSSGTGLQTFDLHILSIDKNNITGRYDIIPNSLYADNVHEWMIMPMYVYPVEDSHIFRFEFAGASYTVDTQAGGRELAEIHIGSIVYYEISDDKIEVVIAIAAIYKPYASPWFFGDITATVLFDGVNFILTDYVFTKY